MAVNIVNEYRGFVTINNRLEGRGTVKLCNGNTYEGEMRNGTLHGTGNYVWSDGVVYMGDFDEGRITGKGRYEWPDGSWYLGEVRNGQKHGYGSYCDGTNFVFYVGNWYDDKKHGQGRLDYNAEGTWYYNGDWYDDKRHGNGVQHFESGSIYNGEWRTGYPHGWGTMYFKEAEQLFDGMWREGKRHGHGEQYWLMSPSPSVCLFQHHMYKGHWVDDKRNGFGIFVYADGSKYEGYWKDDRKSGEGKFFHKNGARNSYDFDEDKIIAGVKATGRTAVGPHRDVSDGILLFCPDVDVALPELDGYDWKSEKQKIRNLILVKITSLRRIYYVYSRLGKTSDSISAGVLDCTRFLQMCRDLQLDKFGWSLGRVMAALRTGSNRIPWPRKKLIPWKFVRKLIILSYRIFTENSKKQMSAIECFNLFLTNHVERWNKQFNGVLFADPDRTPFVIDYVDTLFYIYRRVCAAFQMGDPLRNITVRHFLCYLKELHLLGVCNLSVKNVVTLLSTLIPCFKNEDLYDFDLEMTFLDFIDAILLIGDAFYFDLSLSQSKEVCGRFTLTESSETLLRGKTRPVGKKMKCLSVGPLLDRILSFKDMLPEALSHRYIHEDNRIMMRAQDKNRIETEIDPVETIVITQTRSQKSCTSSSDGNLYTHMMRHFSFDKLGDLTGRKDRDFWVLKMRRFLENLFLPIAHIWMVVHTKVDWIRSAEAELAAIESFSNIILPHAQLSTIWFDES